MTLLAGVLDGPITARTFIIPAWLGNDEHTRLRRQAGLPSFSPIDIILEISPSASKALNELVFDMRIHEYDEEDGYKEVARRYPRRGWYLMPWSWLEEGLLGPEHAMGAGTYVPEQFVPDGGYYVTEEGIAAMQVLKDWLLEQGLIES